MLTGDRLVITGVLTLAFALGVLVLMVTGVVTVGDSAQMLYVFQALVGGNLTLITIVLSINQLVLSREFNTPGELQNRIDGTTTYRQHVEETTDRPTLPVTPSDFLFTLTEETQQTARRLREAVDDVDQSELTEDVDVLVSALTSETDHTKTLLADSQDGIFSALVVTLQTNYSHQINEAHRLQAVYEDDLTPDVEEEFSTLAQNLKELDIARQYFKSVYTQSELARLSRFLLYVGIPAVGSSLLMLLVYASTTDLSVMNDLKLFVPVIVVVGFTPLAMLAAFILRVALVAQQTIAITPFTIPTQEKERTDR